MFNLRGLVETNIKKGWNVEFIENRVEYKKRRRDTGKTYMKI